MALYKIGRWLILFIALVSVCLLGLFGAAAQTPPLIFATNTPHSSAVNATSPATRAPLTQTPVPNATTGVSGITRTFYTLGRANVRECARLDCVVLGQFGAGEAVSVTGETTGESVGDGSALWYQVDYSGREGYIYGGLLSANPISPAPQSAEGQSIAPVGQVGQSFSSSRRALLTCNRQDNLSCSDFGNVAQAQFHLNMCGDEDNLDTDDDGFACEASQP